MRKTKENKIFMKLFGVMDEKKMDGYVLGVSSGWKKKKN